MPVIVRDGRVLTLNVASGATTTTEAVSAQEFVSYGIIMPGTITSTTMTFTVCDTVGGTYVALYDSGNNAVSVTIAASRAYDLPAELASWPFWKIVMGSSEGAARVYTLVMKA